MSAALLAALTGGACPFDAIVVGEYERAFFGTQLIGMTALFARHGVQVWLPEAGGPINIDSPTHQALMTLLGAQSQREVLRSRYRVLAAMQNQVVDQGRYLGGRPPYGYRLVDAGPHPNRAHAHWGRRLRRLDPDPLTAAHVRWISAQRLAGHSVASIARTLNDRGVPCPSRIDPERNSHRSGEAWTLRTVSVILNNPRYTGREVWNRTRHNRHAPASAPHPTTQACVVSKKIAHPPLVTERDFLAVQAIRSARPTKDGSTRFTYLLTGLLRCRLCRRRMDSHWVNGRPGYRCRHGHTSTQRRTPAQPKTLYVREDLLLTELTSHLTTHPTACGSTCEPHGENTAETQRIAAFLRSSQTMIIYDGTSWSLDTPDRARQANPTPDH